MTPVLPIKRSKPGLHQGKTDSNVAMTRGWGRYVRAMLKIDNELIGNQPGWT